MKTDTTKSVRIVVNEKKNALNLLYIYGMARKGTGIDVEPYQKADYDCLLST